MRMLVTVTIPMEPFNSMVRDGSVGAIIGKIVEDTQPESINFTDVNGHRAAVMIVDLPNASLIPSIAEPWFLKFNAKCEFKVVMSPDDLMNAGLDKLGEKWN